MARNGGLSAVPRGTLPNLGQGSPPPPLRSAPAQAPRPLAPGSFRRPGDFERRCAPGVNGKVGLPPPHFPRSLRLASLRAYDSRLIRCA